MELRPGTMVTPNVRLERLVGKGAMGEVWVAEHLGLQTQVAVKFVLEDRLEQDDPEVLERFTREAAVAAQVKSSHVVQKFDHGVMKDGTPYIVMEHLEGERLDQLLARKERLPLPEVAKIVWQTAKALQSAHKLGIIHRDIKPDNIFLSLRDDESHVKVFDFGVAKLVQVRPSGDAPIAIEAPSLGITNDGVLIGTPEYMSPEQVMNAKSVDHFADLWALAVTAYVSLTGELPFVAEDVGKLCVKLLESDYVRPSQLIPDLPKELDGWFATAFAKRRAARFQSARELARALTQVPGASPATGLSGQEDALGLMEPSVPEGPDASEPSLPGLRIPTLSDSTAMPEIAALAAARRRSSILWATLGLLSVGALVTAFAMSGSAPATGPAQASDAAASAPQPATDVASQPLTTSRASAEQEALGAGGAAARSAEALRAGKAPARTRSKPRRKDPGF